MGILRKCESFAKGPPAPILTSTEPYPIADPKARSYDRFLGGPSVDPPRPSAGYKTSLSSSPSVNPEVGCW